MHRMPRSPVESPVPPKGIEQTRMHPFATSATSPSMTDLHRLHPSAAAVPDVRAPGSNGSDGQPPALPLGEFDATKSYREIRAAFEAAFERAYVAWLLGRHGGNISAAAREARMDRKYLYDLAREHGLRGART